MREFLAATRFCDRDHPDIRAAALDAGADEFDVKASRVAPLGAIVRRFWAART